MRKIHFNEATINEIRDYINEGHSVKEACNRFTLKYDTMRRVLFENGIVPKRHPKTSHTRDITDEDISSVCNMYEYTNMRMQDISKQTKLPDYVIQKIIHDNFSEQYINNRKSKLYSFSKSGTKNPLSGKLGKDHPNYKEILNDGNGYLMEHRPDWWTSRNKSAYVFQHHIVVAKELGLTQIPKGFVVHHIDGNTMNNDISNLALVSMGGHAKWHSMLRNLCKVQRLSEHGVGIQNISSDDPNA